MNPKHFAGPGASIFRSPIGDILCFDGGAARFGHPWKLDVRFEADEFAPDGEWRAYVQPGFVNGCDTFATVPAFDEDGGATTRTAPLTDADTPWIALTNWRNPLASAGLDAAAALDGSISALPGESYPAFFDELGVRNPAEGGDILGGANALAGKEEPNRDRELRAIDIILTQPRISARVDIGEPGFVGGGPILPLGSAFSAPSDPRARIRSTSKFTPPDESADDVTLLFGAILDGGDRGFDQIHLGTVWIVSPPDAGPDAVPDVTWEAYPQHYVFWNLKWAAQLTIEDLNNEPIALQVPLAGGVGQSVIDFILSMVNQMLEEVREFVEKTRAGGIFWT